MGGVPSKILVFVDEYSRCCLALVAVRLIRSSQVTAALVQERGSPTYLRSDKGPEFVAESVCEWLQKQNVQTIFITPEVLGKTPTWRAFWTSCAVNVSTGNIS